MHATTTPTVPSSAQYVAAEPADESELVLAHLGVAQGIARCYRNQGIPADDLEQVARLGLVGCAQL